MIIPAKIKDDTITKLKSLLKYYLVDNFLVYGYDPINKQSNKDREDEAKLILKVIDYIDQDKDIHKERLETLFLLYKKYHDGKGELWNIQK